MGPISIVLALFAIGISAGLVAGVLPFFRRERGVAVNLLAGIAGALTGGYFGRVVLARASLAPLGFLFALVGALVVIVAAHTIWSANEHRHHREG